MEPIERSRRDWIVDVLCVVLAFGLGVGAWFGYHASAAPEPAQWLVTVDLILGPIACLALWLRRRWPLGIALALLPAVTLTTIGAPAAGIALFGVAVHRPARTAVPVAVAYFVACLVSFALWPQPPGDPLWVSVTFLTLVVGGVLAWGMYVRARRELVATLRDRLERAEAEQEAMAQAARADERTRIAREMHDVVAHRVSLIALHAGGLELQPDVPAEDVRDTAGLIRRTARMAMEDLRGALGVLRASDGGGAVEAPQPTLADLPRLVEDSRRAGEKVELALEVPADAWPPEAVGRDAYRVVQEALTNAHKHARGAATSVAVHGAPGDGLAIEVRNRLPVGQAAPTLPGAGAGLVGLRERVTLAGGEIEHGPSDGDFVVRARLRWER
ncbi:MAG: sensor histidine kinase [Solirubrobacteraceae bacterium]|nr:sensor histidine kinase [Solirubrobacteraceae bacterium]